MARISKFVDMALKPSEQKDSCSPCVDFPSSMYPYGLCISFGNEQLEKLKLDATCEVGDLLHMFCLAKVTSVSKNDTTEGTQNRIELQITAIAMESEDAENAEADAGLSRKVRNPYKKGG